jgi:hypothetical protein
MGTENELMEKYEKEHVGNPHVEHELSFTNWRRFYLRFVAIEKGLDRINTGTARFEKLDRESQWLAGILGY